MSMLKANMKILLVDDVSTMRKMIKGHLQQMGFTNVSEAEDGEPAWKLIQEGIEKKQPYEFIISDWDMPGLNGLELVKNIRSFEPTKKLPFLMITADADQTTVVTAVKAGVNNFIIKPFSVATLKEKIDKIFNK
ncbi:MAG: response regulator [Bacteriovoracaceae bacterium]